MGKPSSDDKDLEDDFGRSLTRYIWFKVRGVSRSPPAYLHWSLIYVASTLLTVLGAWASSGFSVPALCEWASDRPTAMFAIFVDFHRGVGLLPQLHMSRRSGYVCPGLAVWIALMGVANIVELLADGFVFMDVSSYVTADIISFALVSDFMWIFIKSRMKGQKVVELPLSYDV